MCLTWRISQWIPMESSVPPVLQKVGHTHQFDWPENVLLEDSISAGRELYRAYYCQQREQCEGQAKDQLARPFKAVETHLGHRHVGTGGSSTGAAIVNWNCNQLFRSFVIISIENDCRTLGRTKHCLLLLMRSRRVEQSKPRSSGKIKIT